MSYLKNEKYNYGEEEKTEMLVHSIKANKVCGDLRKDFNLCRGNVHGKFIEPQFCEGRATKLIDCFQEVYFN